jgi:hypothetical protein
MAISIPDAPQVAHQNPNSGVDWKNIYTQYYNKILPDYEKQAEYYRKANQQQIDALQASRDAGVKSLDQSRQQALGNAYINRRLAETRMPAMLGAVNQNGGAAESTLSDIYRTQQNANNATNRQYSTDLNALDLEHMNKKASLGSAYQQQLAELEARKREDAFNRASFAYQAQISDENLKLQREQAEWQRQAQQRELDLLQQQITQAAQQAAQQAAWLAANTSSGVGSGSVDNSYAPAKVRSGGMSTDTKYQGPVKVTTGRDAKGRYYLMSDGSHIYY